MTKRKVLVSLSEELLDRLDGFCEEAGVSRSAYISILLAANLPPSTKGLSGSKQTEDARKRDGAHVEQTAESSYAERLGIDLSAWAR